MMAPLKTAKATSTEQRLNDHIAGTDQDTWHSLGSLSNFTVVRGRYRARDFGEIEIDIHVTGNGSNASSTTFANQASPGAAGGVTRRYPLESGRNVTAGDPWPRCEIDTSGNVTIVVAANVSASFSSTFNMPTDA